MKKIIILAALIPYSSLYASTSSVKIVKDSAVVKIEGKAAKKLFNSLNAEEASAGDFTYRYGENLLCVEFNKGAKTETYYCELPYSLQGDALNPQDF